MRFVVYQTKDGARAGIQTNEGVIDIEKTAALHHMQVPSTLEEIIRGGTRAIDKLREMTKKQVRYFKKEEIVYAPCIANPEKILCVGLNYRSHTDEFRSDIPKEPVLFGKFNNALSAHKETIHLPKTAKKFDYEAELVIIIGREASNVSVQEATDYIFGYTAGNDFSARDLQFKSAQWLIGKTCDGFAPTGPVVVTADEIDAQNLDIRCEVNGEIRQSSNTCLMIFTCAEIVSYASKYMTLKPGDIIFTGTPGGVMLGYPEEKQVWLKAGDHVVVEIEGIGMLENWVG